MNEIQKLAKGDLNFFLNQNIQVDVPNFILSLIFAVVLSYFVQLFYIKYSSSLSTVPAACAVPVPSPALTLFISSPSPLMVIAI